MRRSQAIVQLRSNVDRTVMLLSNSPTGSAINQLAIADNGSSTAEDSHSKIFDPFFTSKPIGQGTGLGLTICYQTIVEAHKLPSHLYLCAIPLTSI